MSKENCTPASMAYAPEKPGNAEQPHARKYPGAKTGAKEKVRDASHDAASLKKGYSASLGTSENGSHKGLPVSYEYVGHKSGTAGKDAPMAPAPKTAASPKHSQAALEAGRQNSLGQSADGSHKGIAPSMAKVGQV